MGTTASRDVPANKQQTVFAFVCERNVIAGRSPMARASVARDCDRSLRFRVQGLGTFREAMKYGPPKHSNTHFAISRRKNEIKDKSSLNIYLKFAAFAPLKVKKEKLGSTSLFRSGLPSKDCSKEMTFFEQVFKIPFPKPSKGGPPGCGQKVDFLAKTVVKK